MYEDSLTPCTLQVKILMDNATDRSASRDLRCFAVRTLVQWLTGLQDLHRKPNIVPSHSPCTGEDALETIRMSGRIIILKKL